jgi:glycosyltransferase involved in cell wall biosynthesis
VKASIVIATYNYKDLLLPVIAALESQQLRGGDSFDVLLVDDGSSDGTGEAIARFAPRCDLKFFYLPRTASSSAGAARNHAIDQADGEVTIIIDADGIPPRDFVQSHLDLHRLRPDLVAVGFRNRLKQGMVDPQRLRSGELSQALPSIAFVDARFELLERYSGNAGNISGFWNLFFSCNASARTEHLRNAGRFDTGFKGWGLEDCDLGLRLQKLGLKFVFARASTLFDQHQNTSYDDSKYRSWLLNLEHFKAKFGGSLEVSLQEIFVNFFNPAIRVRWHDCFYRFETATRCVLGRPLASDGVELIEVTHALTRADLDEIVQRNRVREVVVLDHQQSLSNDVQVQTLPAFHNLRYLRAGDLSPETLSRLRASATVAVGAGARGAGVTT